MSIKFKNVSYIYSAGSPLAKKGLDQVSFTLREGELIALIGHTGSGKSTLMQHFNALLKPAAGEIQIAGYHITSATSNKNLKPLRRHVSIVFQFPEAQLFENTVLQDIEFGPLNFGFSQKKAEQTARAWLKKVGLPDNLAGQSPFDLSGGQMRRVAIAGVMAYQPDILCLDEPAAGLDPEAKEKMMQLFVDYKKAGHTVILVTHNMDDVARYADDVLVMEKGKLIKHARPAQLFADRLWLKKHYLDEPSASRFAARLTDFSFKQNPLTITDLAAEIVRNLKEKTDE